MNPLHDPGCGCAGCSPESRRAMQMNQRALERARRDVVEVAKSWAALERKACAAPTDGVLRERYRESIRALVVAVERLQDWEEADRAAKSRRRGART